MSLLAQAGLLAAVPAQARYLRFQLRADATATAAVLQALAGQVDGEQTLVGLGASLAGCEDRLIDRLFSFTRPIEGAAYWCPPMRNGRLDLRGVGL
jgi:deferrochelatase/peroxidase EfeB